MSSPSSALDGARPPRTPTLADCFDPHHNALTLLRLGFALLVVLGHAYEVGGFGPDPLHRATGVTFGELGVNSFFAISGFLVTGSWLRSRSLGVFLTNRALRIFPGLWACLLLTGFGLFPWLAHRIHGMPWPADIFSSEFARYVGANALLKVGQPSVAQLFASHPAAGVANGSLWSLLPEFLCYFAIAGLGALTWLRADRWRSLLVLAGGIFAFHLAAPLLHPGLFEGQGGRWWWAWRFSTQAAFFAGGSLLRLRLDAIPVPRGFAAGAAVILGAVALAGGYHWIAPILLPYLLLALASVAPGRILESLGDYSYGVYVYHYPMQQTLLALNLAPAHATGLFALTVACTLPPAVVSWHLIEAPALRLKPRRR